MNPPMQYTQIKETIVNHGGTIDDSINWTWAVFDNDTSGKACYEIVSPFVESRGYYDARPDSENPNLRKGGFRFR